MKNRKVSGQLRNAVRTGKIIKPTKCERCGKGGKLDGHHKDYSKPLEAMWLCYHCHRAIHNFNKEFYRQMAFKRHKNHLTEEEVKEIKKILENYSWGLIRRLAKEYGVSPVTINDIKLKKTWNLASVQ